MLHGLHGLAAFFMLQGLADFFMPQGLHGLLPAMAGELTMPRLITMAAEIASIRFIVPPDIICLTAFPAA